MLCLLQGLVRQVIHDLFAEFKHHAVTQDTLLCMLSLALAGCSPERLTGTQGVCSAPLADLIPQPAEEEAADGEATGSGSGAEGAALCAEAVGRWMSRLRAWVFEPGVQQVELHVGSTGSNSTALQTYQAQLLPNSLPAQVCPAPLL